MSDLIQNVSGGAPIVVPELPFWLKCQYPDLAPDFQVKFLKRNGEAHFASNVGHQTWALLCPYREMLTGGRRGGGKSVWLMAWMAMGDPTLSDDDPAKYSFLNDPDYRGLILRKEYQSLSEFIDRMAAFYRPFNVKTTGGNSQPVVFEFKSGAKIYTNHLNNEEAYEKYRGWSLTRIGIEELTQIPTERQYRKLFGSLRSADRIRNGKKLPPLRIQIAGTTNPDGVGREWVKKRFVRVPDVSGKSIPWNTPMRDPISKSTRIFIPFPLEANPYYAEGTAAGDAYREMLMGQDEVTRAQWLEGDWDAGSGAYFRDFRDEGPRGQEEQDKFPWANHVITSAPLKPWWFRWAAGDAGYNHPAVFHKLVRNEQDKRVHIYDELSVRFMDDYELGILLAKWWLPELEGLPDHQITLFMGEDAFAKESSQKTPAERISAGIQEVLGPYGSVILKYSDEERAAALKNPEVARAMFDGRVQKSAGHMMIALKPQHVRRVDAFKFMREMMRFRPSLAMAEGEIKEFLQKTYQQQGVEAYESELEKVRSREGPEILPRLQIWKVCGNLIDCIKKAHYYEPSEIEKNPNRAEDVRKFNADENGLNGDDALESARNGLAAYREIQTLMPKMYYVEEQIQAVRDKHMQDFGEELTDPTRLAMISATQSARWQKQFAGGKEGFTLPRAGAMRHRVN